MNEEKEFNIIECINITNETTFIALHKFGQTIWLSKFDSRRLLEYLKKNEDRFK